MFKTEKQVIDGLKYLYDHYHLNSSSIVIPSKDKTGTKKKIFKRGFIEYFDPRNKLIQLLKKTDERYRKILLLYYTFSYPIDEVSRAVNVSIRHCYRLKKKAIEEIIRLSEEEES